jgi:Protein of unknown function (DUF3309)
MQGGILVVMVLVVAVIMTLPTWPYSTGWGYGLSSVIGSILLGVMMLVVLGVL